VKIRSDMTNRTLPPKLCVNAAIERLEAAVRLDPSKDYSYYQLSVAYRAVDGWRMRNTFSRRIKN
jgi:hypothetical protein